MISIKKTIHNSQKLNVPFWVIVHLDCGHCEIIISALFTFTRTSRMMLVKSAKQCY